VIGHVVFVQNQESSSIDRPFCLYYGQKHENRGGDGEISNIMASRTTSTYVVSRWYLGVDGLV
jgi:hypothetical protein